MFKIEADLFVGMGSKSHVDGLEEVIGEVNSEISIGEKELNK